MLNERFSAEQDEDASWHVHDSLVAAPFTLFGGMASLTEERARLITRLLNALERKRIARRASFARQTETRH